MVLLATARRRLKDRAIGYLTPTGVFAGVAVGIVCETIAQPMPLGEALKRDLGITPVQTGIAICITLIVGLVGTIITDRLTRRYGPQHVAVALTLAMAGVASAATFVIRSAPTLYLISGMVGLLACALLIVSKWMQFRPRERRGRVQLSVTVGIHIGLFAARLPDALLVGTTDWEVAYQCQAVLLGVGALLLGLSMRGSVAVGEPRDPLGRSMRARYRDLTAQVRKLPSAPRRLRKGCSSSVRIAFWQQGLLWGFDTIVVFLILAKGLPQDSLGFVFGPILLCIVMVPVIGQLEKRRLLARLVNVGLVGAVWPLIAVMQRFVGGAGYVTGLTGAVFKLEAGTAIWTWLGPLEVAREQSLHAQRNLDLGRKAGQVAGIILHVLAYWLWGVRGVVACGLFFTVALVYEGLLGTTVQRRALRIAVLAMRNRLCKARQASADGMAMGFHNGLDVRSPTEPHVLDVRSDVLGESACATSRR